jgi:hypothetical protein
MQTLAKSHCAKLCCLSLLFFIWGALFPAYACSSETDKSIVQLQNNTRANISAKDWLAQAINKTSNALNLPVYDGTETDARLSHANIH